MTNVVLDDHLVRDLLANEIGPELRDILTTREPATTNLYYFRLCRSAVAARGGALTGYWPAEQRQALGRRLIELGDIVRVLPMQQLAFEMATHAAVYQLSALGAEAIVAAKHLGAPLCVSSSDIGPRMRAAADAEHIAYLALQH